MTAWTWALLPQGQCWIRQDSLGDLYIERADPRILISARLVEQMRAGDHNPAVDFDPFIGILKIRAKNHTVVYRLVEHVQEYEVWIAEWPD